ncbi:thiol:disulfide interchange protein DsbE [Gammaproteobacteria bacterium]|nr:thiol:disulfide interchange protein DsbE [Gammaproteobacteria bacterium]
MKVILVLVIVIFLGFLGFLGLSLNNNPQLLPSVLEGKMIPEFSASQLENPNVNLTQASIQGPALINVWATWCPTCRSEHQMLNLLSQNGIPIYGISYKDEPALALDWLKELGNPYVFNINDAQGKLGIDLGVYGAPETFFINKDGLIVHRHVGDINPDNWKASLAKIWDLTNAK